MTVTPMISYAEAGAAADRWMFATHIVGYQSGSVPKPNAILSVPSTATFQRRKSVGVSLNANVA